MYPLKSWRNKYLKHCIYKNPRNSLLYKEALYELSEYTKEPEAIVEEKYRAPVSPFVDWENTAEEDIERFYRNDTHYLYELPLWNAERNRGEYIRAIVSAYLKKINPGTILVYGGGAGDITISLAWLGFKIAYADINKQLIDFVKWRFSKRGLDISIYDLGAGDELPVVDCVVSFDVLEHLKNLPLKIKKISGILSAGGSFIFSGAFSGGDAHLKENEIYGDFKELNSLFSRCGFSFEDKFAQFYFYKK